MHRGPPRGLRARADAVGPDGELALDDGERVLARCAASMTFGEDDPTTAGILGALYVTDARVAFVPTSAPTTAHACEYTSLALHAVSREDARFGAEGCVYCQIDGGADAPSGADVDVGDANEPYDEDDPLTAHVRFAPTSGATVDEVYAAMSEGSMLNPDPRADGDDDDDGDFFASVDAAADGLGASARDETSERLDKVLVVEDEVGDLMRRDPSRFED